MERCFWLCFLFSIQLFGQKNLIVNGSFEQYTELPSSTSQIYRCVGWFNPDKTGRATPDYLRTDAAGEAARLPRLSWNSESVVSPRTGKAVASIFLCSIHEYLSTSLLEPLEVGKTYRLTFYASIGAGTAYSKKAVKIGTYFSVQRPQQTQEHQQIMEAEPQYQTPDFFSAQSWQKISFTFLAKEAYRFLTFGSFDPNHAYQLLGNGKNLDAYVFFDDVELILEDGEKETEPPVAIVDDNQVPQAIASVSEPKLPTQLEGRTVQVQKEEMVFNDRLEIEVYDNKSVDGDIISLNFNGEWVLKEYTLKKKPLKLKLNIKSNQTNYLILYAHNLGKVPPNTAYLNLRAGKFQKSLTLSSGLSNCGAIVFKYIE